MIIIRSPLRISFVGGGSDLPFFYKKKNGQVFSFTINKYMYIFFNKSFHNVNYIKYSKKEVVNSIEEIKHPIAKSILKYLNLKNIDVSSMCDIPGGLGLGSSSAYTAGFLKAGYSYINKNISKYELATRSCMIEINKLKQNIGKQDQFATVFGGFNKFVFKKNEEVSIKKYEFPSHFLNQFYKNTLLIYVGGQRSANNILTKQIKNSSQLKTIDNLQKISNLTNIFINYFNNMDFKYCGKIMNENWHLKKSLTNSVTNKKINMIYDDLIESGAYGGKLLGAGSGGFIFMFMPSNLKNSIKNNKKNINIIDFKISNNGTERIF